jgi:hypothetical protein
MVWYFMNSAAKFKSLTLAAPEKASGITVLLVSLA